MDRDDEPPVYDYDKTYEITLGPDSYKLFRQKIRLDLPRLLQLLDGMAINAIRFIEITGQEAQQSALHLSAVVYFKKFGDDAGTLTFLQRDRRLMLSIFDGGSVTYKIPVEI